MMIALRRFGRQNRIGRRLIVAIVAFSSLITLFTTAFQLFFEYRAERADLDRQLGEVSIYLPPLAAAVWSFNDTQVNLAIQSLVRLPHIEAARVTLPENGNLPSWQARSGKSERVIMRELPLTHQVHGAPKRIATLEIAASLDQIYDRVLAQAITILAGNALKTFLVAAFMYELMRRLVTARIERLADNVGSLLPYFEPQSSSTPNGLAEDRAARADEIDSLEHAFEDMGERLKLAVEALQGRNQDLLHEVGERRRAEDGLQKLVGELSRANSELERFAYVAAHDLQEPVRGLVSFSQMLDRRHGEALDTDGRDYLNFIIDEAMRMSHLVADLLEYSRAGMPAFNPAPLDCAGIVEGAVDSLRSLIDEKRARIDVGPMPVLVGDRVQLHQLFRHLIGNGVKYTAETTLPLVRISAARETAGWAFAVSDNGIGIEAQYHGYIFEVFRRLHTRNAFPGTGIGLSLCRRIAENHGGRIWVESEPGKGAVFRFTIPDPEVRDNRPQQSKAPAQAG